MRNDGEMSKLYENLLEAKENLKQSNKRNRLKQMELEENQRNLIKTNEK